MCSVCVGHVFITMFVLVTFSLRCLFWSRFHYDEWSKPTGRRKTLVQGGGGAEKSFFNSNFFGTAWAVMIVEFDSL